MINGMHNFPYERWLKQLNLHSLERRRTTGDFIETYKWLQGYNKGDVRKIPIVGNPGQIGKQWVQGGEM